MAARRTPAHVGGHDDGPARTPVPGVRTLGGGSARRFGERHNSRPDRGQLGWLPHAAGGPAQAGLRLHRPPRPATCKTSPRWTRRSAPNVVGPASTTTSMCGRRRDRPEGARRASSDDRAESAAGAGARRPAAAPQVLDGPPAAPRRRWRCRLSPGCGSRARPSSPGRAPQGGATWLQRRAAACSAQRPAPRATRRSRR